MFAARYRLGRAATPHPYPAGPGVSRRNALACLASAYGSPTRTPTPASTSHAAMASRAMWDVIGKARVAAVHGVKGAHVVNGVPVSGVVVWPTKRAQKKTPSGERRGQ